jgi:predicted Ser/Thr protein kinase
MSETSRCGTCGGPLPVGALGGRCPSCLLAMALEPASGTSDDLPTFTTSTGSGSNASGSPAPAQIARYRILRLIGEGGMGAVYEAEQEHPRRTVALKIIKPGLATPELLRRFEQEAQALGRLQHPGIAQIYEAGTADTGFGPQPYFAMEFIRGRSLKDYVEEHHLDTRQRLEMFARIAEAVHHAHQRGLIHRDLKPGNILVDEAGQPKILDFGVVRVTDSDAQATMQTDVGQLVGTLAYMSPEQVVADPLELDTRSDVYALGVILYEMLAGRLPYTISKKLHEAIRAIREEDPARLSSINRTYRGDIETIVAKALEKDKSRRYGSAAELAADIQRYLNDEPIVARPPSTSYQLQKFAYRHKALVFGIAAVFLVLVVGIAGTTLQAVVAGRERDRAAAAEQTATQERDRALQAEERTRKERDHATTAEQTATQERDRALTAEQHATSERNRAVSAEIQARQEAATANALNDFLQKDLLAVANPTAQLGELGQSATKPNPNLTVREALDRASARIAGKFDKQPIVEAALRETIAGAYISLGFYREAQSQLERSTSLRSQAQGEEHRDTLFWKSRLASLYAQQLNYGAAFSRFADVVAKQRRVLTADDPDTVQSILGLASLRMKMGDVGEAENLFKEVWAIQRRKLGEENEDTVQTMLYLSMVYRTEGKVREAEELVTRFRDLTQRLVTSPAGQAVLRSIASALQDNLQMSFLVPSLIAPSFPSAQPGSSLDTLIEQARQAVVLTVQGKYSEAEALYNNNIMPGYSSLLGARHPTTLSTMMALGQIYNREKKYDAAQLILTDVLNAFRSQQDEQSPAIQSAIAALGEAYRGLGHPERAEALIDESLNLRRRTLDKQDLEIGATRLNMTALAIELTARHKWAPAEELWVRLLPVVRRIQGDQHPNTISIMVNLGEVRVYQQKYTEAEMNAREALSIEKAQVGPWLLSRCKSVLGGSLTGQKRYAEAESLLLEGYNGMIQNQTGNSTDRAGLERNALERIVRLYEDWGKQETAAEWRKKAGADAAFPPKR